MIRGGRLCVGQVAQLKRCGRSRIKRGGLRVLGQRLDDALLACGRIWPGRRHDEIGGNI